MANHDQHPKVLNRPMASSVKSATIETLVRNPALTITKHSIRGYVLRFHGVDTKIPLTTLIRAHVESLRQGRYELHNLGAIGYCVEFLSKPYEGYYDVKLDFQTRDLVFTQDLG
ncbi:hypothetical protein [Vibrio phage LV6]|nr:hypothetical protein [Vibrio phage LV6]